MKHSGILGCPHNTDIQANTQALLGWAYNADKHEAQSGILGSPHNADIKAKHTQYLVGLRMQSNGKLTQKNWAVLIVHTERQYTISISSTRLC